jgi:hypothetical protein
MEVEVQSPTLVPASLAKENTLMQMLPMHQFLNNMPQIQSLVAQFCQLLSSYLVQVIPLVDAEGTASLRLTSLSAQK